MKNPEIQKKKPSVASRIIAGLEEFAQALENNEKISERFTCRKVILNLQPKTYGPEDVRKARRILGLSQALFAQFLGVSPKTVRAWEQGTNIPKDSACRLMDEIQRNPEYWRRRLLESMTAR